MAHGMHGLHGVLAGLVATAVALVGGAALAEPTTIPTTDTGVPAPRCTVGQPCTFAAPIFVCDYASAERMAGAGPLNGRAIGMGLLGDKTCQSVPAGDAKSRAPCPCIVQNLLGNGERLMSESSSPRVEFLSHQPAVAKEKYVP